jgi:hypothetical protein
LDNPNIFCIFVYMRKMIETNGILYQIQRTFKGDGWFDRAVKGMNVDDILQAYHCDKILKDSNGLYHLVNEIKDVGIIEEVS